MSSPLLSVTGMPQFSFSNFMVSRPTNNVQFMIPSVRTVHYILVNNNEMEEEKEVLSNEKYNKFLKL